MARIRNSTNRVFRADIPRFETVINDLVKHFKLHASVNGDITQEEEIISDTSTGERERKEVTIWKRNGEPLGRGQMGSVFEEVSISHPQKKRAIKVIHKKNLLHYNFDVGRELRFLGIASKVCGG